MVPTQTYDTSIDALFFPHRLRPFQAVTGVAMLERAWRHRPGWVLAQLAHLAYLNDEDAEPVLASVGATAHRFYDHDGAQATLASWPAFTVLAFRGTELFERSAPGNGRPEGPPPTSTTDVERQLARALGELGLRRDRRFRSLLANDVLADLRFEKCDLDADCGVRVHRGFLRELDKLWSCGLLDDLTALDPGTVHATGHSLGGALATLAGTRFPFQSVVTFGEPRVGRHVERAFRAKRHLRFVLGDDPVPRLPPRVPFRFHHHGELRRLVHPSGMRDLRFDHAITNYVSGLASAEPTATDAPSEPADQSA